LKVQSTIDRYTNSTRIADKLKKLFNVEQYNVQRARGWIFPSLSECRAIWSARYGGEWNWHRDLTEWSQSEV
jgi:hypothetical protein